MATTPTFPLPLRNALAELAIAALDDPEATSALAWLASADTPAPSELRPRLVEVHLIEDDGTLLEIHRHHTERIRAHATRATRAAMAFQAAPGIGARERARPAEGAPGGVRPANPLPTDTEIPHALATTSHALAASAALWAERLFFEVHEVLEAVWKTATGPTRNALQGVIQIAVALHHHGHGNARGARTLMREGRERLAATPDALPRLDAPALLAATAAWEAGLAAGTIARDAEPPALPLRP